MLSSFDRALIRLNRWAGDRDSRGNGGDGLRQCSAAFS
jgi:hypothetical protein